MLNNLYGNMPLKNGSKADPTLNKKIDNFIDCMYAQDLNPDYLGYTGIYLIKSEFQNIPYHDRPETTTKSGKVVKERDKKFVRLVCCQHPDRLPAATETFYINRNDLYVQKNRFKKPNSRMKKDLFGYSNIVIDIDCHNNHSIHHNARNRIDRINALVQSLEDMVFSEPDFPHPNAVVYTGRGIQLWWHLLPVYAQKSTSGYYQKLVSYFISELDSFMENQFSDFSIDVQASKNEAGLVRLPGTFNTKSGCYGDFYIYHNDAVDLRETVLDLHLVEAKHYQHVSFSDLFPAKRECQLENLLSIRHDNLQDDHGYRDYYLFFIFNAYLSAGFDEQTAMEHMLKFNSMLTCPLSEYEAKRYMSSSLRVHGYRCTNKKMIEALQITDEEQMILGLSMTSKNLNKPSYNIDQILSLRNSHLTMKEIAEAMQCSVSSVYRIIGKYDRNKSKEKKHIRTKVLTQLKKGISASVLLKRYSKQISRSSVYALKKQADAWIQKKEELLSAVQYHVDSVPFLDSSPKMHSNQALTTMSDFSRITYHASG